MIKLPDNERCYWLQVCHFDIYLPHGEIPFGTAKECGLSGKQGIEISRYSGSKVWLVPTKESEIDDDFVNLRSQLFQNERYFHLLNKAVNLNYYFAKHRFCGVCGHSFNLAGDEMALQCAHCGNRFYPKISPSIIVAVRRGREILLANHQRHKGSIYTTLAGFTEAGENLEETVRREVFEETGIMVKNIRYFGSQPWSFPDSLMVGFLADYDGGKIRIQEAEIHDARWFDCDAPLPELPPQGTIALQLIQATLTLCRQA